MREKRNSVRERRKEDSEIYKSKRRNKERENEKGERNRVRE